MARELEEWALGAWGQGHGMGAVETSLSAPAGIVRCSKHGLNLHGDPARGPSTISRPVCAFLWFTLLPLTVYISMRYFPFATNSSVLGDTAVNRRPWLPFWRPAGTSGSK